MRLRRRRARAAREREALAARIQVPEAVTGTVHAPAPVELALKVLPELTVAVLALVCAVAPEWATEGMRDGLYLAVMVEAGLALAQGTLTDVATRLRKPPPWWLALAIVVGLALFLPGLGTVFALAHELGWLVLLGLLWSGGERLRELWTMPLASRLEKLRRRALVGGRITLVLAAGGVATAALVARALIGDDASLEESQSIVPLATLVAAFYAATAIDVVRVHRAAFARRPRTLLRLDPLGIEYLSPP